MMHCTTVVNACGKLTPERLRERSVKSEFGMGRDLLLAEIFINGCLKETHALMPTSSVPRALFTSSVTGHHIKCPSERKKGPVRPDAPNLPTRSQIKILSDHDKS